MDGETGKTCQTNHSSNSSDACAYSESNNVCKPHIPNGCIKHCLDDNGIVKIDVGGACTKSQESSVEDGGGAKENKLNCNDLDEDASRCDCSDEPCKDKSRSPSQTVSELSDSLNQVSLSDTATVPTSLACDTETGLRYVVYESEKQMPDIMRLITKDLSEPYSIYTYRYFIHNWPKLCFLVSIRSHLL